MTESSFRVEPVAGALGAQIHGVNLALPPSGETFAAIREALHRYVVIFFRDQDLTAGQHVAFARRFGLLERHPYVSGLADHPDIIEIVKEPDETRNFGSGWHADLTFLEQPPGGAVLYAREVPPAGGDTMFANMVLAWETLSDGMRRMLEGLGARHASGEPERYFAEYRGMRERGGTDAIEQVHPVVRTHPQTGRDALFVNPVFTRRFESMTACESAPLLEFLHGHATRPECTFRFRWSPGTLLVWDNRVGDAQRAQRRLRGCAQGSGLSQGAAPGDARGRAPGAPKRELTRADPVDPRGSRSAGAGSREGVDERTRRTVERLEVHADALECGRELARLVDIVAYGTSADRRHDAYNAARAQGADHEEGLREAMRCIREDVESEAFIDRAASGA